MDRMGTLLRGSGVVIAGEQNRGDFGSREPHDAPAPLALKGGGWAAVFVGIAGENHQVHLLLNGGIHDGIQRFEEVHHAQRQASARVVRAIVSDIDVSIRKMKQFDHGVIIMDWDLR